MIICQSHWDKLRAAIESRGLSHLVSHGGEQATKQIIKSLEGKSQELDYDPLLSCNFMIWNAGLECGGLAMLEGDICPVCEAVRHGIEESFWIDGPADAALEYCRAHKLLME